MKITATLVFHNELEFLGEWFDKVKNYADEIVCAAHAPTDGSLEYVRLLQTSTYPIPIVLLEFPEDTIYKHGFSYMKNATAEKATGDWIVSLDADEDMEMTKETLMPFIQNGVGVTTYTKHTSDRQPHWTLEDKNQIKREANWILQKHWRIYKNDKTIRWAGLIHESLLTSNDQHIAKVSRPSNIFMWHYGCMANPAKRAFKNGLYAELLLRIVENPELRLGTNSWWWTTYYHEHKQELEQQRAEYRLSRSKK